MNHDARKLAHALRGPLFNLDDDTFIPLVDSIHRIDIVVQLQTGCVEWALKGFAGTRPRANSPVNGWTPSFGADKIAGAELKRLE
jgi:hypothetical protein